MTTTLPPRPLPRPLASAAAPVTRKRRRRGGRIVLHLCVVLLMLLWAIPTIGLLVSSFRPSADHASSGWWTAFAPPYHFTMENYSEVTGQSGIGQAFLNSIFIAVPSTIIPIAVAAFAVPPVLQDWAANCGRLVLMTPLALRAPGEIASTWRRARKDIIAVAILCPLSYILVLTAMVFTPVSYVAPAREVSILIAAVMGAQLLKEGETGRRVTAATAMVAGIVCLALG